MPRKEGKYKIQYAKRRKSWRGAHVAVVVVANSAMDCGNVLGNCHLPMRRPFILYTVLQLVPGTDE
jgi:hypothetical protein